ncbi:aminoglycoside phosphotransferase [Barrientosiimonas humi]|uniref:aminoglycoside phosphotransferase n=1 Tax=Barrientosiimonas humi TaxID=999931 RepID=UPI00370DA6DF
MLPSDHVLDLFAVPGDVRPLPGGRGGSVLAGDLVLSPGRDARVADLLDPTLARLAVALDSRPGRRAQDLRIAVPVPARDGSWVVDGWGASRFEPGTRACTDLPVLRATGAVLHAELALAVRSWPLAQQPPRHRWDVAERVAFGAAGRLDETPAGSDEVPSATADLVDELLRERSDHPIGPDQLVHGDLAGNVLIDPAGAPVVIDLSPYWRPALWAEAVCVLDAVMWLGADAGVVQEWTSGAQREAMLRAGIFRLVADQPEDPEPYRRALGALLSLSRP